MVSGVKATLKVVLQANDTIVAESEDAALWQRVLIAINSGDAKDLDPPARPTERAATDRGSGAAGKHSEGDGESFEGADEAVVKFAKSIGVSPEQVVGACYPSKTAPLLSLDMHCWNALKDQTPPRGPGSLSPMAVAATLLSLWKQAAKLGNATQAEAQKVLETIHLHDKNPTRSVAGAEWLKALGGGSVVVNPARIKRATAIARAFCLQDWKTDMTWKSGTTE
jgi:hypothetical protein